MWSDLNGDEYNDFENNLLEDSQYDYLRAYQNIPNKELVINRIKMEYPNIDINSTQFNNIVEIELQSMIARELELRREFANQWDQFTKKEL
jgi:hypothetical protein